MNDLRVKKIVIATEWSKSPTGRYKSDGKSNGTDFRNKFFNGQINNYDSFFIDLDGTFGYGSSFLDEAFAGLIREGLITKEDFLKKFKFKSDEDPSFIEEIFSYIGS